MRRLLILGALLLMLGSIAQADSFTVYQYDLSGAAGATGAAAANGMRLSNGGIEVYAGSFSATAYSTGQSFIAFSAMQGSSTGAPGQVIYSNASLTTGGVSNQLVYLITQIVGPADVWSGFTNAQAAAVQIAVWQLTSMSMFNARYFTSDQSVLGFVSDIDTLLSGKPVTDSTSRFSQFQPYDSSTPYDSSKEFLITPSDQSQQILIGVDPLDVSWAPEPSTLMLAGLGALAFAGYGWRRRKRS